MNKVGFSAVIAVKARLKKIFERIENQASQLSFRWSNPVKYTFTLMFEVVEEEMCETARGTW